MSTASDFILKAFSRAGIRASETALESDELRDGLDILNDMLSEWEPKYQLGFSPVIAVANEVRIPRFSDNAVKWNLAIRLCVAFGRPIPQGLAASASDSLKNLESIIVNLTNVDMPSTLPLGSGNQCEDFVDDRRFFPEKNKDNF